MNIDSLPLTAFALEASGAAALAVGSVHTLTLETAAFAQPSDVPARESFQVSVERSSQPAITLTF